MTLRVAIYARVSTLHQAQAQTIEQQLTRLRAYATDQRWLVRDEHIFRDEVVVVGRMVWYTARDVETRKDLHYGCNNDNMSSLRQYNAA